MSGSYHLCAKKAMKDLKFAIRINMTELPNPISQLDYTISNEYRLRNQKICDNYILATPVQPCKGRDCGNRASFRSLCVLTGFDALQNSLHFQAT